MLDGVGAFTEGLAEGIHAAGRIKKNDVRGAVLNRESMDKANFHREKRNRLRAANDEIAAKWRQNQQEPIMPGRQKQPVPGLDGDLTKAPAVPGTLGAGLSSLGERTGQMSSDEVIGKRILTGSLLENPDELTRMANIYKKYGLLEEMGPWMNEVYVAKRKGIRDALNLLLLRDAKGARAVLERGGVDLADDPMEIATADERQNLWRFKLKDGRQRDIDLKQLQAKFFPREYTKIQPGKV